MVNFRRWILATAAILILLVTAVSAAVAGNDPWLVEGGQTDSHLGRFVAGAGDVNGDGYDDFLASGRFDFGDGGTGTAYAYYGSPGGLSNTPDWIFANDQPDLYTILSIAGAGDVNGDGYDDVIAGASNNSNGEIEEGEVFLFYGSPSGLSGTPVWSAEGNQGWMYFGKSVAGAGDVNGDSYDDLLVGAPYKKDDTGDVVGQISIYLGSSGGPGGNADWTAVGPGGWSNFGGVVSSAGDVNGDGYADFMTGDPFASPQESGQGQVTLFLGSANGPGATPAWVADGENAYDHFGSAINRAGDVNGDGFDDILIGAYGFSNTQASEGRAYLFQGSAGGPGASPAWTVESGVYSAFMGNGVGPAGDVNADGFDDVLIGAYAFGNGELSEGLVNLHLGSRRGLSNEPAWSAEGNQTHAGYGLSVSTAGDVDGDGNDEWAVGAWNYDRGEADEGIAVVYDDLAPDPLPTPVPATPSPIPPPTATSAGFAIHVTDLDGLAVSAGSTWTAQVTIEVRNANGVPVSQATVSGAWSAGGSVQCETGADGRCTVQLSGLAKKDCCVDFTVTDVQHGTDVYQPEANTDPDGDSDGTMITVNRRN